VADNPARPKPGAILAALDDIAPGGAIVRDYREGAAWYSLLLARNAAGDVFAYENVCPHAFAPLERFDGEVIVDERRYLICAMHGASFRIEDGACVGGPGMGLSLTPIAIEVRDENILLT
jgi:nitrite reductase/ring-hydroxylating ferredoxin subunit